MYDIDGVYYLYVCVRRCLCACVCVLLRYLHVYDIDAVLNVSSLYALFVSILYMYVCFVVYVRVSVCCEAIGKCMMSMVY